ncbi:MAG: response regulator [Candidatus Cloacimonetes bacterium]|nr:response regulator [Candidatus Cloacimonadota bacterium]MCF7814046.1 response regulator [Candidatus Cloacimonadota bacterium]MCF7868652.1 response regulator [Candidatus Cloacimonadota bacterium]MCF7884107.1 response regulator [Candidatus Cloacimonadota bacterium]
MKNKHVMLIDDNRFTLNIVGKALEMNGFPTRKFNDPKEAVAAYDPQIIAVVVTDYLMPSLNGLEVMHQIRQQKSDADIIVYSGIPNEEMIQIVKENNAHFFDKPLNFELLIKKIENIFAKNKEEKCVGN